MRVEYMHMFKQDILTFIGLVWKSYASAVSFSKHYNFQIFVDNSQKERYWPYLRSQDDPQSTYHL